MKRIAIYCGSNPGQNPLYLAAARAMGRALAARHLGLVFGGGRVGLMGAIADAALEAGTTVHGVIPEALATTELAHRGVTELHVVKTMHERKALMADLADAFVAMPGGFGTLDELFEMLTWGQLGFHTKPVGLLDAAAFFAPLLAMADAMVRDGFVKKAQRDAIKVHADPAALLDALGACHVARPAGPT
jgi:uncharacterized protein (TIGR00730 family)